MPIVALPPSAVRAIGSLNVISDPCSVIKELLDNALDAGATSVAIEVSQNTLDVIQAKDNGFGIASDDYAVLCKRSFTSKIRTLEDLQTIGGRSLGFRGEALASIVEISGGITVITRTESGSVGTCLKYGRDGGLLSSQPTSHLPGTTVRVNDFLKHVPVRRQTMVKNASKTLSKTKKMLQAYAMAQPSKRFSFRVLQAKNEKDNWMYAPVRDASLFDAALKIAGPDVAACCVIRTWPAELSDKARPDRGLLGDSEYELVALLPKKDAANCGQFVGVDGRALSTDRGVAKEIAKTYKTYLRSSCSEQQHAATVKNPFLGLHVRCVPGKYDVNVEPSKDDVLFEDLQDLLSLFEGLLCGIYGELKDLPRGANGGNRGADKLPREDGFDILLSRRQSPTRVPGGNDEFACPEASPLTPSPQCKSAVPRQTPEGTNRRQVDSPITPEVLGLGSSDDRQFLNPWSIAKINVPSRSPERHQAKTTPFHQVMTVSRQHGETGRGTDHGVKRPAHSTIPPALLSPASTSIFSSPGNSFSQHSSQLSKQQKEPSFSIRRFLESRRDEREQTGTLASSLQLTSQSTVVTDVSRLETAPIEVEPPLSQLVSQRFSSVQSTPDIIGRRQPENILDLEGSELSQIISVSMGPELPGEMLFDSQEPASSLVLQGSSQQTDNASAVEEALDFERRKKEAMRKRREQLRGCPSSLSLQAGPNTLKSPHQNRYQAARASLSMQAGSSAPSRSPSAQQSIRGRTSLSPDDPRAYLIRQSGLTHGAAQPRRIKTDKLPLERTPQGAELHTFQVTQSVDLRLLSKSVQEISETDIYVRSGNFNHAFDNPDIDVDLKSWDARMASLLEHCYGAEPGALRDDLHFDLRSMFDNTHSTAATTTTAATND